MRSDSNAAALVAAAKPRRGHGRLGGLRVPNGAQVVNRPFDDIAPSGRDGITAAAQVLSQRPLDRKKKQARRATAESWQDEAWELRDETGELRFIGDRQARAASQARLFVGKKVDPAGTPEPVADGIGAEVSAALFANVGMSEQVVKRAAQHLIYNGESNLLVAEDEDTGQLVWSAHSVSELTGSAGRWRLNDGTEQREIDDDTEILIRCWTPHPEWLSRADAPVRAVLPIARELRALSMYVSAQVESRLAGAGLLLLPEGIESMHSQGGDDDDDYPFADELTDYFVTPVTDRDTAAAVTPFMATVDPELIDKIKHLRFDTPLDEHAPELRDESIRRVGLGMDSDPSVLLGQGSGNHWSAWAVDESEIKYGVQPILATICHALTVGLLRPLLIDKGVPPHEVDLYSVWYDTTPLIVRPDRSKDAQALFDKDVISASVLRQANGFSDVDAPEDDETNRAVLMSLLQSRPDWADKILPVLGIVIPGIGGAEETAEEAAAEVETAPGAELATPGEFAAEVAPEPANGPPVLGETEATR